MTLITLIMEQNGPGAGGWVLGFPRGHNARSRSIQIEKKSKGEVPPPGNPLSHRPSSSRSNDTRPSYPDENIQIATLSQRERRLVPEPPSIGFNGHRYSNLFDGGFSSFISLPLHALVFSLALSSSPRDKNRYA